MKRTPMPKARTASPVVAPPSAFRGDRRNVSLVAFKARNHKQKVVDDAIDDRRTPQEIFAPLHAEHCFTLDAAASDDNALLPNYFTRHTDGLLRSWKGHRVWCNPPYSRLEGWVAKAWDEMACGCKGVVMLLPANRCEQPFWQKWVEPWRDGRWSLNGCASLTTTFLPGRPRFGWHPSRIRPLKGDRPPFGLVLLTWAKPTPAVPVPVPAEDTRDE